MIPFVTDIPLVVWYEDRTRSAAAAAAAAALAAAAAA